MLRNQAKLMLIAALTFAVPLAHAAPVLAAPGVLSTRSVTVDSATVNAVTAHTFRFTIPSYQQLGSIKFEYCENNPFVNTPCTAPTGLNVSGATLAVQTGETGFTLMAPSSPNMLILTRSAVAASGVPVMYRFQNIQNPDTAPKTVYVRISTYIATDATGSTTDEGSVIFAASRNISVNGYVPPYLTFCVGVTIAVNCSSAEGSQLDFGELSKNATRALKSEYSGASNDVSGFATTIYGGTMTSGNNVIEPIASPSPSLPGTSQFGANVRANSNPGIGSEPQGPGTSTAAAQYGGQNQFFFGSQVISSSPISTDFKKFTVSYIVNIPANQRPGVYVTTITYIASASF